MLQDCLYEAGQAMDQDSTNLAWKYFYFIKPRVILFNSLCDRVNSFENEICSVSQAQTATFSNTLRDDEDNMVTFYCLKGLQDIENLTGKFCQRL